MYSIPLKEVSNKNKLIEIMKTIIFISLLFVSINSRTVYMCHDDPFKDEQCMKTEKLGSVNFVWVRKCKGAKVCVDLPYYGGIIGSCSIKVRSHYDGESCANNNKCTSGICGGTSCKGLNPGVACEVGLGQCQKGYLCRKSANTNGDPTGTTYTCQKPLANGAKCSGFVSSLIYSDPTNPDDPYWTIYDAKLFDPANNPCGKDDVCSTADTDTTTPKCIKIGSVGSDKAASHPLACSTGYLVGGTCKDTPSSGSVLSLTTSRGAAFNYDKNISNAFGKWKEEWGKKNIKDEDFIYEAYRYTKNKKKINEAFFRYTHAGFVADADECAYDYMWKNNSSDSLKFSLMILILALLF